MEGEEWDVISNKAKNLLRGMLCVDQKNRLSAAEVMSHEWMT
jgi:serine/threonine protein kinase